MAIRVRVCIKINVMIHNKNDDYALANVVSLTSCLIKQTKILNIYLQLFPISTRLRQKSNFKLLCKTTKRDTATLVKKVKFSRRILFIKYLLIIINDFLRRQSIDMLLIS